MDQKKRMRKPVVCNVCRRRKIRCDKAKPVCTACKKANMSHLCSFDEDAAFHVVEPKRQLPGTIPPFSVRSQGAAVNGHFDGDQQQRLQQQQAQFQHQLLQKQHAQLARQSEMAAKYGLEAGQPLTGASVSPQVQAPSVQGTMPYGQPVFAQSQPQIQMMPAGSWGIYSSPVAMPMPQMPPFVPQSYNYQQNLQSELDTLRRRMMEVEGSLNVQGFQPSPVPTSNGSQQMSFAQVPQVPDASQIPLIPASVEREPVLTLEEPGLRSDDNIDPVFFDPEEIVTITKVNVPQSKYLKMLESDGLFENTSLVKKDVFQTLFMLHVTRYGESLPDNKKLQVKKHTELFHKLIKNPRHNLEEHTKFGKLSLTDIIKDVERRLPPKRITWILIDKFFKEIRNVTIPILSESEFTEDISQIIGPREDSDARIKLQIDMAENDDLINFHYLLIMIRSVQISLIVTINIDKQNEYLLKNCGVSNDYDDYIEMLHMMLTNFNIGTLSHLKLSLFRIFFTYVSFNGQHSGVDFAPASLASMAITLAINNKDESEDDTLSNVWNQLCFYYHHFSCERGLPILITEDFFNVDPENSTFKKADTKVIKIRDAVRHMLNKLNVSSSVMTLTSLDKLMREYDEAISSTQGSFEEYKNLKMAEPFDKVVIYAYDLHHKLCKSNVLTLIFLHFEMVGRETNSKRFHKYFVELIDHHVNAFRDFFDSIMNFDKYFQSGHEYTMFACLLPVMEKHMKELSSFILRSVYYNKRVVALIKFFLNVIEELEGYPVLKNYFHTYRIQNRSKLFLCMMKRHVKGELNMFELDFEFEGQQVTFEADSFPKKFAMFSDDEWLLLDKRFDQLNERFQTSKYNSATTIMEALDLIDFEEPLFEFNYLV